MENGPVEYYYFTNGGILRPDIFDKKNAKPGDEVGLDESKRAAAERQARENHTAGGEVVKNILKGFKYRIREVSYLKNAPSKDPADGLDELAEKQGVGFPPGYEYLREKFPRQMRTGFLGITAGSDGFGIDHMSGRQSLTMDVRGGKQLTITYDPRNNEGDGISWVICDKKEIRKALEQKGLLPRESTGERIRAWLADKLKSPVERLKFLSRKQKDMLQEMYPDGFGQEMEQNNVGDCYFVAMLHACNQNPVMPYIAAHTITQKSDHEVEVDFLGKDPRDQKVLIDTKRDLKGQVVVHRSGREEHKFPLTGQPGDRVLERAFARQRRLKEDIGSPYSAPEARATRARYTMVAGEGGHSTEPLALLFGDLASTVEAGRYSTLPIKNIGATKDCEKLLRAFARDPTGYILTAVTPAPHETPYYKKAYRPEQVEKGEGSNYFMDSDFFFFQFHAFTVIEVDETARTVTVVNPHNTAKLRKVISFEEFGRYFSILYGVALNKNKINAKFGGNIFDQ